MVKVNIKDMVYYFLNIPLNLFSSQLMLLVNHSCYLAGYAYLSEKYFTFGLYSS